MGVENRLKLEARLRNLEGRELSRSAGSTKGKPKIEFYNKDQKAGGGAMITPAKTYNAATGSVLGRIEAEAVEDEEMATKVKESGVKKDKKKKKKKGVVDEAAADEDVGKKEKKEKKKKKHVTHEEAVEVQNEETGEEKKKKKKRKHAETETEIETASKKKEKKKKNRKVKSEVLKAVW